MKLTSVTIISFCLVFFCPAASQAQNPKFKAIAFYTSRNDQAHISFVHEAHKWFYQNGLENNFSYDSTNKWDNMNDSFLSQYQVVIFLDTRPEVSTQREAFEKYMKNGGAWMGFHFAGFAMTPSEFPQNWDWYHEEFIGAGQFVSNTWRPTSAVLRAEEKNHPALKNIPEKFKSAPSEWYRWANDLRKKSDIKILLSIDPSSFPLGTGPKLDEIWHSGYYPVMWTNIKYRMLYLNVGHNDIDYENKTNKTLSYTFGNAVQDQLILNGLLWLGNSSK